MAVQAMNGMGIDITRAQEIFRLSDRVLGQHVGSRVPHETYTSIFVQTMAHRFF